jgi:hypothetical protein
MGFDGGEQIGLSHQTVMPTPIGFFVWASQLARVHAVYCVFASQKVESQNHGNDDTSP